MSKSTQIIIWSNIFWLKGLKIKIQPIIHIFYKYPSVARQFSTLNSRFLKFMKLSFLQTSILKRTTPSKISRMQKDVHLKNDVRMEDVTKSALLNYFMKDISN